MQEAIIRALQHVRTPLWDTVFLLATGLGEEAFIIGVSALIYWNVSKRAGYTLAIAYVGSMALNDVLRLISRIPRPYEVLAGGPVPGPVGSRGFAFPSTHTQGATTLFATLALLFRRNHIYLVAAAAAALVGISRIYLGVQWPLDVLAGWVLGALVAFLVYRLTWRRQPRLAGTSPTYGALRTVVTIGVGNALVLATGIGVLAHLDEAVFASTAMPRIAGAGIGMLFGFLLEDSLVSFRCEAAPGTKVARYLLGMATTMVLLIGFQALID
ncbi:MAG: phosphatase PAP2 family protein, partial [Spirochaetota bacterium]